MIPNDLVYRIYGDALAVIMSVPQKRVILLQGEILQCWKRIAAAPQGDDRERGGPLFARLASLGLVEGLPGGRPPGSFAAAASPEQAEVDMGVVNLWAFKNQIPISGHFELTGRCNLRCRHCYCVFETRKDSLSTGQIFRIVDDLKAAGTLGLVLTGGEIFFRNDMLDILTYLSEQRFVVRINSNGTLIDEAVVQAMAGLTNIYRIHISLYGHQPEIHDRITNAPGSFHKTVRALHLLKEAGFDLRINCSVMRSNYNTFHKVQTEIGDRLGIPVHFDPEIFPKDDGGTENLTERLDAEQMQSYWRAEARNETPSAPRKQKLCKAGFSFFSICEDGSVYPCLKMKRFYRHPLGNLALSSFKDIWQGPGAIASIRASLDKKLRQCALCDLTI